MLVNYSRVNLHPADILDDLNVIEGRLLKLQQLGRLLKK
jgi:hypothetical protein